MNKELKQITEDEFYNLIDQREVSVGDKFMIKQKNFTCPFRETVFNVSDIERGVVDTLLELEVQPNQIWENRYLAKRRHKTILDAHKRGTKDYHSLLEGQD